jgi:hypothetical protein
MWAYRVDYTRTNEFGQGGGGDSNEDTNSLENIESTTHESSVRVAELIGSEVTNKID